MPHQALQHLLDGQEYRTLLKEAMVIAQGEAAQSGERAEAFWFACTAAHHMDNYYAATKMAESGLTLAEQAGHHELALRFHFKLGGLYNWVGDLVLAEEHLNAFLSQVPHQASMHRQVGQARYNLGLIYLQRRQFEAAIASLQDAAIVLLHSGSPSDAADAELDTVWAFLHLDQIDAAAEHLGIAEGLIREHPDDDREMHLRCYQALYHRLRGDLRSASACCQAVLTPGWQRPNPHYMAGAAWNAGEIALATGRLEEAGIFADLAQQYAMVQLYPQMLNLVGDLRRRIREQAQAV